MYDSFSSDYDRFVNWPSRLGYEMPFIEKLLHSRGVSRVLDTACGTGMHAIALTQRGFTTAGADLSPGMIARAAQNAAAAGVDVQFTAAGFGLLAQTYASSPLLPFDALLCLGNSLPHLLTASDLHRALMDFSVCLKPGGVLLIQNRNFDAVMTGRQRWMEPQPHHEGDEEWVFLRFYDYDAHLPEDWIDFNILTLYRSPGRAWEQTVTTTRLRPLLQIDLNAALESSGFEDLKAYGSMNGEPFDPPTSGNLIITAVRQ